VVSAHCEIAVHNWAHITIPDTEQETYALILKWPAIQWTCTQP